MANPLKLRRVDARLQVARCDPAARVPAEVLAAPWFSVTRTAEELSLVVPESVDLSQTAQQIEKGWAGLAVEGPLDFALTGILAGLSKTLADADVAIFVVSTFDTDVMLVKADRLDAAIDALTSADYIVLGTE